MTLAAGTRRSIAVFPFRRGTREVLLLQRSAAKGGGWQPVTGRVEADDAGEAARARHADAVAACITLPDAAPCPDDRDALVRAALRELEEETGITRVRAALDLGLETGFVGYDGVTYAERAFAVDVAPDARVRLSPEHDAYRWVPATDAPGVLSFPENGRALARLVAWLDTAGPEE